MRPVRFFCQGAGLALCLAVSSCESPLTVREQRSLARVLPWTRGGYMPDARQGLVYVNPLSPYRGGLRPAAGYHWSSADPGDFRAVPYRGGPYLIFPKYPLLTPPPASSFPGTAEAAAPAWRGALSPEAMADLRHPDDEERTEASFSSPPVERWAPGGPESGTPPEAPPPPERRSSPERKPAESGPSPPPPSPAPPPPPDVPRDKPV